MTNKVFLTFGNTKTWATTDYPLCFYTPPPFRFKFLGSEKGSVFMSNFTNIINSCRITEYSIASGSNQVKKDDLYPLVQHYCCDINGWRSDPQIFWNMTWFAVIATTQMFMFTCPRPKVDEFAAMTYSWILLIDRGTRCNAPVGLEEV